MTTRLKKPPKGRSKNSAKHNGKAKPEVSVQPPQAPAGPTAVRQIIVSEMSDGSLTIQPRGFVDMDQAAGWVSRCVVPEAFIRQMRGAK